MTFKIVRAIDNKGRAHIRTAANYAGRPGAFQIDAVPTDNDILNVVELDFTAEAAHEIADFIKANVPLPKVRTWQDVWDELPIGTEVNGLRSDHARGWTWVKNSAVDFTQKHPTNKGWGDNRIRIDVWDYELKLPVTQRTESLDLTVVVPKVRTLRDVWNELPVGAEVPGALGDSKNWVKVDNEHFTLGRTNTYRYQVSLWDYSMDKPATEVSHIDLTPIPKPTVREQVLALKVATRFKVYSIREHRVRYFTKVGEDKIYVEDREQVMTLSHTFPTWSYSTEKVTAL